MDKQVIKEFQTIFNNKSIIGPIAERAKKNFDTLKHHPIRSQERIYHFAVGHALRNIDKTIFEYVLDDTEEKLIRTKFTTLQLKCFTFGNELNKLISNIRDCNSHYVHNFNELSVESITSGNEGSKIIAFLKEAFEFSVLIHYLKENDLHYNQIKSSHLTDHNLVKYLCDKFYPNEEYQRLEREEFLSLSNKEAIEKLLFIKVDIDFEWQLDNVHPVFIIKEGRYLSSLAQLFLLAMFLYKHEANQLISKIKGFKRTEDRLHYKRDLFTFFSKKVSSQDIHSEEKHLIYFRDITQYLNHYPTAWNDYLSPERKNQSMTSRLEKYIIEKEITRAFINDEERKKEYSGDKLKLFLEYTGRKLFPDKSNLFNCELLNIDEANRRTFDYKIETSPELQNIHLKLKSHLNNHEYKNTLRRKKQLEGEGNPLKKKLLKKMQEDKILTTNGRNQDRFMEFSVRFLAEENYFGKDAEFKMYLFYSTHEQEEFLKEQRIKDYPKEIDKNKYHQGRLTHFSNYSKHLETYSDWDSPIVFQNNAFQIILTLSNGERRKFSIQRGLLIYLMEDALFCEDGSIENRGKHLLEDYFNNFLMPDFNEVKKVYNGDDTIITANHRKLLPKRLLYMVHPPLKDVNSINNPPYEKILIEAQQQEKRYRLLHDRAKKLGLEEDFLKRNKGKQFKLRFIRKAWHIMYFRDSYNSQAELSGHHKSFHITRDEFNDFSKWMYALDEVPQYKNYLKRLFDKKNFLSNEEFSGLFNQGNSLDYFYVKTKDLFKKKIEENSLVYDVESKNKQYEEILSKKIVYINLSHYIQYLKSKGKLSYENDLIQYKSLVNRNYLIDEYYYTDVLDPDEYKSNGKLFNKLRKTKLEDCILYELALKYLKTDPEILQKVKTNVSEILTSDITFDIRDADGKDLYQLVVPFNKLETLAVLIRYKTHQENIARNNRTSYLGNIYNLLKYLNEILEKQKKTEDQKKIENKINHQDIVPDDLKKIVKRLNSSEPKFKLQFEELNTINNYIISGAVKFSKVHMELERYFIHKYKIVSPKFIDIKNIKDNNGNEIFNNYYDKDLRIRQKAFHFGVPDKFMFEIELEKIEKKFIQDEITPLNVNCFADLNKNAKSICDKFIRILHSDLYRRDNRKTDNEKNIEFCNNYFLKVIKRV
ncbi:MAG TPA: hypothetical protein VIL57_03145 [Bacteroidia bacterium]